MRVQQWSAEQQEAIYARGGNLLVAAAAGAGKTSVLVERIISYLKDVSGGIDVDRLLVVTFTNAAAAEMRERIGRELARELERQPDSRHLRRQLTLLNHASIGTLHSFCLEVVRRYFYRLHLDPNFRVADDGEAELLQFEVLEELLEAKYQESGNENFLALVDCYGGERDDAGLVDIVLKMYRFARSNPWPEEWLQKALATVNFEEGRKIDDFEWCRGLKDSLALELQRCHYDLEYAIELCREPGGPGAYLENLYEDLVMLKGLYRACQEPWENLSSRFQDIKFGTLKRIRKGDEVDSAMQKQVQNLRDKVKRQVNRLRATYFSQTPEQHLQDLQEMAAVISALVQLVREFGESFRQAKHSRGMVDFDDLEHYCLQILLQAGARPGQLEPSAVALELQERFIEVLVDEYQDINAVQETILQLVSRQGQGTPNLFMVGDVKQSIYRFRLAEPRLFLDKYHRFSVKKGRPGRRINLKENFRSAQNILDGVNFFFRQLMTPYVGEIAYDKEAELVCGRGQLPGADGLDLLSTEIEIHLIDRKKEDQATKEQSEDREETDEQNKNTEGDNEEELLEAAEIEARLVARSIKRLVDSGKYCWDKQEEQYRPIRYGDVAVLMRATRGVANIFMDEFRQAGIPAYAELGTGYFAAGEVETILSLLQVIDNPRQDIPLITVLRSPLVGLTAEELAEVRCCDRDAGFYQASVAAVSCLEGEVRDKLALFFDRLETWRTLARHDRITSLLGRIYRDTHYYDYVGGLPGGIQRQANLRLLETWAGKYEATAFRGLFHFLRFVERLRESGGDMGSARALSENEDVVRVMSIHKSKGLEFPVVFVTGLGRQFNFSDLRDSVLTHKEFGLGPQFTDTRLAVSYPTLAKLAVRQKIKLETLAEEMRLLYVAMTRAREKLFLVGTVANLATRASNWCRLAATGEKTLPEAGLAGARCYLDWVGPALVRHSAGESLREIAGYNDSVTGVDQASFKVHVLSEQEAGRPVTGLSAEEDVLFTRIRQGLLVEAGPFQDEVNRRLNWKYPHQDVIGKVAKATATEIKRLFDVMGEEEETADPGRVPSFTEQPRFIQKVKGLSAAERGIAIHTVLQHLDLRGPLDEKAITEQVACMVAKEILTPEQAGVVSIDVLVRFFVGELGRRILQAREVLREVPFTLALPARQVHPGWAADSEEHVIMQGVIDCLADEGDGFLLIDYKTDWLGPGRLEELIELYRPQLTLYTQAVETIFKQPVKEKYLYFLSGGIARKIQ